MYECVQLLYENRIPYKEYDAREYQAFEYRTFDTYSKRAIDTLKKLYSRIDSSEIDQDRLGIVLAAREGPNESIRQVYQAYNEKDYIGINPSIFPNIMMSTALMHCSKLLNAHGASSTIYINEDPKHALDIAGMQIKNGRCDYMIFLYVNEFVECYSALLGKK